jgi:uncharacterized protein YdaU (DUF1376 family)
MPIHIGDYKRDTGHLRAAGHGAYLLLLFHHWSTGSLPDDDEQLSAIACMTPQEWKKMRPVMEKFFKPGWVHGRVVDDLEAAKASYERRALAGCKGGKAKAKSKQSSSNATAGPEQPLTFNHSKDSPEAKASGAAGPEISEASVFQFGKSLLGKSAGGQITKLRKMFHGDWIKIHGILLQAEQKGEPGAWIAAVLKGSEFAAPTAEEIFPTEIYGGVL